VPDLGEPFECRGRWGVGVVWQLPWCGAYKRHRPDG